MKPTLENYKDLAWEAWELQKDGADLAKTVFRDDAIEIATYAGIPTSDVTIIRCPPVGEDCVYIKGVWSGYLDGWVEQGHIKKGEAKSER